MHTRSKASFVWIQTARLEAVPFPIRSFPLQRMRKKKQPSILPGRLRMLFVPTQCTVMVSAAVWAAPLLWYPTTVRRCVPAAMVMLADIENDAEEVPFEAKKAATLSTYTLIAVMRPVEGTAPAETRTGEVTLDPAAGEHIFAPALAGRHGAVPLTVTFFTDLISRPAVSTPTRVIW
jgi:hypothetical protein